MPSPDEITWMKMRDSIPIYEYIGSIPEDRIQIRYDLATNQSTLQIKKLEYSDEGAYLCIASTDGDTKSVGITLRVVGKFVWVAASIPNFMLSYFLVGNFT